MKISVIGLGVYSLAISKMLAKKSENKIVIWTENEKNYEEYKKTKNIKSVFDTSIPKNIKVSTSMEEVLSNTDIIYIITASKYVDLVTKKMKDYYKNNIPICIASKGIEESKEELLSNIVSKTLKTNNVAVISGPTFAVDILNNEPVALALASKTKKAKDYVLESLANDTLKLRPSKDIIGIQMCGAIKNVIAIASGMLDGLKAKESTRAMLLTEALHDMEKIIVEFGGKERTILSYAGFGDLLLTCSSEKSRNYRFGKLLGQGVSNEEIDDFLAKNTVEGYNTSNCIYKLLKEKEIKIPMINLIHRIVMKKCEAKKILTFLIEKD